jgi:hypothetical protein
MVSQPVIEDSIPKKCAYGSWDYQFQRPDQNPPHAGQPPSLSESRVPFLHYTATAPTRPIHASSYGRPHTAGRDRRADPVSRHRLAHVHRCHLSGPRPPLPAEPSKQHMSCTAVAGAGAWLSTCSCRRASSRPLAARQTRCAEPFPRLGQWPQQSSGLPRERPEGGAISRRASPAMRKRRPGPCPAFIRVLAAA